MAIQQVRVARSAVISECTKYRYSLTRIWDQSLGVVAFVGLNPSTADANTDDATIRTCMRYSDFWGYGGICMLNLFAFRTRSPAILRREAAPIGPLNDWHLEHQSRGVKLAIACWGVGGNHWDRACEAVSMLPPLFCLAVNKDGTPHHPLYLPSNIQPAPWPPTRG